jgi:integrase
LPPHLWWATALALYTGQRQSDVLAMNWSAIDSGGIEARQSKTGKVLWLPIHRDLRPILDAIPRTSTRILTNGRSLPWASGLRPLPRSLNGKMRTAHEHKLQNWPPYIAKRSQ